MTWRRGSAARVLQGVAFRGVVLVGIALAGVGCGRRPPPAPTLVSLGGHAARVGDTVIPASLVAEVASARAVARRGALDGLVRDALLAEGAKAAGVDAERPVQWLCTTTLARLVPDRLAVEARGAGPPTDLELATVEVIHAVVLRAPALAPARASATAEQIMQAVAPARDDADFRMHAQQVPHAGMQVTVERLAPFDASGHDASGASVDAGFTAAAFTLRQPGETSTVVETPFGWHVIRLIARVVPTGELLEARRRDLSEAVVEMRVRTRLTSVLREERRRRPAERSVAADALMSDAVAREP